MLLFLRGFPKIQNFPNFKFFPTRSEGGSLNFHFFPNSKKSKTSWGRGEGSRKWPFPLLGTFFNLHASPGQMLLWQIAPWHLESVVDVQLKFHQKCITGQSLLEMSSKFDSSTQLVINAAHREVCEGVLNSKMDFCNYVLIDLWLNSHW